MGLSIIQQQKNAIITTIENITQHDWKVLVLDETTKKIIDNAVSHDDILNKNIANIEYIEERREMNPTMDAIYVLSPKPHIVDCLLADLGRRRYRRAFLVWTAALDNSLQQRLDTDPTARKLVAGLMTLPIDFFPRESHLVTFRDPWSFPILYHPGCNDLVRRHMESLSHKIASVCIAAGEFPKVRYYRPPNPTHDASVLCTHLARFVQDRLDHYARRHPEFPPQSLRPPSVLLITDRSMDLVAPLVHEFTYQAMAHDLLPIKDGDKATFHMTINEGEENAEEKDMELQEKDAVWVDNRHRHMKDTIDKLMADFQKFLSQNPQFTDDSNAASLNTIKDMLAGLPQFQEMKEAYSLHLTMAQECMNKFQSNKLPDVASIEQSLATGLDEDHRRPRNVLDQIVRLLDDEAIAKQDRLRLIMLYVLYRRGVILEDVRRLLAHAALPNNLLDTVVNLGLLGGHPVRASVKEAAPAPPPLFSTDGKGVAQQQQQQHGHGLHGGSGGSASAAAEEDEYALSRFQPNVRHMLDFVCRGQLDPAVFPYVHPPRDPAEDALLAQGSGTSLRAVKSSWAGANRRVPDNRQRIFVFVAGGATYSEARACYEASARHSKDVVLVTSHMLTPHLFCRQVGDLSADPRLLDIPLARPPPKAPAHLFEPPPPPPQAQRPQQPAPQQPQAAAAGTRRPVAPAGAGAGAGAPRAPSAPGTHGGGPQPPTKQMGKVAITSPGGAGGDDRAAGGKLHKKRNLFGLKKKE